MVLTRPKGPGLAAIALALCLAAPARAGGLGKANLRQAEERLAEGDLETASAWARAAVAEDPGPETFDARHILIDVALLRGELSLVEALISEAEGLAWLGAERAAWVGRARLRLAFEGAEGAGDLTTASELLTRLGAEPLDARERAWLERATWHLELRALEQSADPGAAVPVLGKALERAQLDPQDRAWLEAARIRVQVAALEQSCQWSSAQDMVQELLHRVDLRQPDRRWGEVRLEMLSARGEAASGLVTVAATRVGALRARPDLSASDRSWVEGMAALLALEGSRGAPQADRLRWKQQAEAWRETQPACVSPPRGGRAARGSASPRDRGARAPLEAGLDLGLGASAWSQRPNVSDTPFVGQRVTSPIVGASARAALPLAGPLGARVEMAGGFGIDLPVQADAALGLSLSLGPARVFAGGGGHLVGWARADEPRGEPVARELIPLPQVRAGLGLEGGQALPWSGWLRGGYHPGLISSGASLRLALSGERVEPTIGLDVSWALATLRGAREPGFELKVQERALVATAGARWGRR